MTTTMKSAQLQIRVSPSEKATIQRAARHAGMDMSAYVLARVLPALAQRFAQLTGAAGEAPDEARFALAELSDWLARLSATELREAVATAPAAGLAPYLSNYVAAMVELACARSGLKVPRWTADIPPLEEPRFGSSLVSLRLHLLTHSPPPFRRRNIFIDSSVGSRV